MADYSFITLWRFRSPLKPVWELVYRSEEWPAWWRGVERVERLEAGDSDGVGALQRYTWKSKLPYRLAFDMRLTRVEPHALIEGEAVGELTGHGLWRFTEEGGVTRVQYDWNVRTTKPWMNLLAPFARPVFKWNHDVVMNWGAEGIAGKLGVERLSVSEN
ncbi:MAG TPA: SRPBCC family protein [Pyrinomonadaceae bacterium]|nr:SRPBCC family protein [Pyrinomonadaceae bacterium]